MLLTDIPYLEPLLFHLRRDECLKDEFTEKSFFMPHSNLVSASREAMDKNCPAPRALWILPQDSLALVQKNDCKSPAVHTFYIEIIVQCMRDQFDIVERDGCLKLEGQFMSLMALRKKVKDSVREFSKTTTAQGQNYKFYDLFWVKDTMLYPNDDSNFLATAIEYQIKLN